ncbi:MAG: GntR family transcriptional regulator [Ilumatobacteraceae bacterium]
MRTIRYHEIADTLRARVARAGAGQVLPSEAELSGEFGASRVTVRRALEVLRHEGLVESRQGFGWFVAGARLRQRLGRLDTIEQQVASSGLVPTREVLEFAFVDAPSHVADRLGCAHVLRVKRRNLADGVPFAVVTVWCPADLGQHLSRRDVERRPFYELLGVTLRGATQTIGADIAGDDDAALLAVPVGSPLLRCERLTTTVDGRPVLLSEHRFSAHRTEFVVDLPTAEPSVVPSGLRLVE